MTNQAWSLSRITSILDTIELHTLCLLLRGDDKAVHLVTLRRAVGEKTPRTAVAPVRPHHVVATREGGTIGVRIDDQVLTTLKSLRYLVIAGAATAMLLTVKRLEVVGPEEKAIAETGQENITGTGTEDPSTGLAGINTAQPAAIGAKAVQRAILTTRVEGGGGLPAVTITGNIGTRRGMRKARISRSTTTTATARMAINDTQATRIQPNVGSRTRTRAATHSRTHGGGGKVWGAYLRARAE